MPGWFIDALDARAGTAFVSHREADLAIERQGLDVLAVHVAPPDFQAKTVTSRSLGLGATRGSFQLGLFSGESEIAFPSLDAVISFVRRVYVASGGGDGAAGGGGVPPIPPDGPEDGRGAAPATELRDEEARSGMTTSQVDRLFKAAAATAQSLEAPTAEHPAGGGAAALISCASPEYAMIDTEQQVADRAALAVVEIGCELIQRCPDDAKASALPGWWASVRALAKAANMLCLWPLIAERPHFLLLEQPARWLVSRRGNLFFEPREIDELHRGLSQYQFSRLGLLLLMDWPAWRGDLLWALRNGDVLDPIRASRFIQYPESSDRWEDLRRWPLPRAVRDRHCLDKRASVADFLSLATGAAPSINGPTPLESGILLLAAGHLTCANGLSQHWVPPSNFVRTWHAATFAEASRWLKAQMPDLVFPMKIEGMIQQAILSRYA